jgi:hypothetical protein
LFATTAVIVVARPADAAVNFHSGPSVDVEGTQICTSANASGLGNENIIVSITAQFTATTTCRNHGGNVAPGQPLVTGNVNFTSPPIPVNKNGRAQIDYCTPVVTPSSFGSPNPAQVCPNGNWTVDPIQQGDITVLGYSVTVTQGSNTLYTCSSSTGTCTH